MADSLSQYSNKATNGLWKLSKPMFGDFACMHSGILGTLLLIINLLSFTIGQIQLTVFSVAYLLGSFVVTAVLLIIAIAYEKVEVALKILLNIGKEKE